MSKLNRNTENQEHASHLPEHGPIDENGKEVLLSLKNVDITFGKGDNAVRAVKNATFDIHKGETFSLVGESGSGKTTIGHPCQPVGKRRDFVQRCAYFRENPKIPGS